MTSMTKTTKTFGLIFIFLGLAGYFLTDRVSGTALIPMYFGLVMVALGKLAEMKENLRKHVMHAIVLIVILGFFGSASGLVKLIGSFFGGELERPVAVYFQAAYALLSAYYIVLALKSFIDARRNQP